VGTQGECERAAEPYADPIALWRAMQSGQAQYVDVRTSAEFCDGHPPGAVLVPLYEMVRDKRCLAPDFIDRIRELRAATPGHTMLVLACQTGARSRQAMQVLTACGIRGIVEFPGGWRGRADSWGRVTAQGWLGAALPAAEGDDA